MAYSGKFIPIYPLKYKGDHTNIIFRSSWERLVFMYLDKNPDVKFWQSEEFFIPYICSTDNKIHRYFIDCMVEFYSGAKFLIEIKPKCQTIKPLMKKGKKTKSFILECYTYSKNSSKWTYAMEYCRNHGFVFQIWTEETLRNLGIKI